MSKPFEEHDYIGLSQAPSSKESSEMACASSLGSEMSGKDLNFKATELRLGLPGSESPDRGFEGFRVLASGARRGFLHAINGGSGMMAFVGSQNSRHLTDVASAVVKEEKKSQVSPAAKDQVVGWPPIRSFRKNSMIAIPPKKEEESSHGKSGPSCVYVKVSMDGAPYLRKVDLKNYASYKDLSLALKNMFSCFTFECVLTFEDKDGDWMLVGDLPWELFVDACKRLRIMRGSDTTSGLAGPRVMEGRA